MNAWPIIVLPPSSFLFRLLLHVQLLLLHAQLLLYVLLLLNVPLMLHVQLMLNQKIDYYRYRTHLVVKRLML